MGKGKVEIQDKEFVSIAIWEREESSAKGVPTVYFGWAMGIQDKFIPCSIPSGFQGWF